jgi:nucleotide-binding universal stress UspA family protein
MKKIVVLTDFSKQSKVAVLYAIGLAKIMEAKIILLSVINAGSSSKTLSNWKKIEDEMLKGSKADADRLISEVQTEAGEIKISYVSILGFPLADMVDKFAIKNKIDFIVMGTKGATGLRKALIGSNAAAVIDKSSIPVMVVPGKAQFDKIQKIVYASDIQNLASEIKMVAWFARFFDASIDVLHVVQGRTKKDMEELERNMASISKEEQLIKTAKYPKIQFHVLNSKDVSKAVDKFVSDQKTDLLTMFTHQLDFYERLFDKGITRKLAFHSKVPMLTFNKTNLKVRK